MIGVQDHCEMQSQTFILATTLPIQSDHEASSRYTQTVWRPPSASWRTTRSSTTPHPESTKLKDEDYPGAVVLGLRHQPQLHRTNPTTQSTETCPECNGNLSGMQQRPAHPTEDPLERTSRRRWCSLTFRRTRTWIWMTWIRNISGYNKNNMTTHNFVPIAFN